MGFFSWLTADTKESIANVYSGRKVRTVYLLRPDGQEPIEETAYEGYGEFGGVDAYEILAEQNAHLVTTKCQYNRSLFGIALECGRLYRDVETGQYWSIFHNHSKFFKEVKHFNGTFDDVMPEYGKSPNELIGQGRLAVKSVQEFVGKKYRPLKFSFNKEAQWEDLPASEICPNQGCFY